MEQIDIEARKANIDTVLDYLIADSGFDLKKPDGLEDKQRLMRALMNIRPPHPVPEDVLRAQDHELLSQLEDKGIVWPKAEGLMVWQGDITRLQVDAIVNAANSRLLGCFVPLHGCIDNAIHSAAGMQLREACNELMTAQGHDEPTASAKITPAFNLPSRYVIHTVGPIIPDGVPTPEQQEQLAQCYRSCLDLAEQYGLSSIAFCCISTGEFRFPQQLAAQIAVRTVRDYPRKSVKTVIFNTFKDDDDRIYKSLVQ